MANGPRSDASAKLLLETLPGLQTRFQCRFCIPRFVIAPDRTEVRIILFAFCRYQLIPLRLRCQTLLELFTAGTPPGRDLRNGRNRDPDKISDQGVALYPHQIAHAHGIVAYLNAQSEIALQVPHEWR